MGLYFFLILHQTATMKEVRTPDNGCISSLSYIKPQLSSMLRYFSNVVFLPYPTSNRNAGTWTYSY